MINRQCLSQQATGLDDIGSTSHASGDGDRHNKACSCVLRGPALDAGALFDGDLYVGIGAGNTAKALDVCKDGRYAGGVGSRIEQFHRVAVVVAGCQEIGA